MFKRLSKPPQAVADSPARFAQPAGRPGFRSHGARSFSTEGPIAFVQTPAPERSRNEVEQQADIRRIAARPVGTAMSRLPHQERLQRAFGRHDLSSVRAFAGPAASRVSRDMNAEAFAAGEKMVFRSPTPSLHTVAHEAAHVVQQRAGLRPTGGVGRVGDAFERQANAVAQTVVRGGSADTLLPAVVLSQGGLPRAESSVPAVQRIIFIGKEPANPVAFKPFTLINTFSPSVSRAFKKFTNPLGIANSNLANSPNVAPVVAPPKFAVSDFDGSALFPRGLASDLSPEIDHIVRFDDGGSSSSANARVISKRQNNSPAVDAARPDFTNPFQTKTVVYADYEIEAKGFGIDHSLAAGDVLSFAQVRSFYRYATGGTLASWAAFDGPKMRAIVDGVPSSVGLDVEIRQE